VPAASLRDNSTREEAGAMDGKAFGRRYGRWALVAGASEGLGEAFAWALAERGLDLVLVARRRERLEALCRSIAAAHGVAAEPLVLDLASGAAALAAAVEPVAAEREIGLLVYDAGLSVIGPFMDQPLERHLEVLETNARGPLVLSHLLGRRMVERGRGGIVLMTSLAGFQGSPLVVSYAATKAFDLVLAEGLWDELRAAGVDVTACAAGQIDTPNFWASEPSVSSTLAPKPMAPAAVACAALDALGRRPLVIAGAANLLAATLLHRLLPRTAAIRILGRSLRAMYPRFG
jgi:short-subunit dehydrogenase